MDKRNKKFKIRRKKSTLITIFAITFLVLAVTVGYGIYSTGTSAPGTSDEVVPFLVEEGDTYASLGEKLEKEGLIKNALVYKIYIRTIDTGTLYAGYYPLKDSMSLQEAMEIITSGKIYNPYAFYVTFPEGSDIPDMARIIESNSNTSAAAFIEAISDVDYLNSLIEKYWFITDEILNSDIYYPLEGYLFPNTYLFSGKDMAPRDMAAMMLLETEKILNEHRSAIEQSGYSVHQLLSMASVVEMEVGNANDRAGIAGIFFNRLNSGWNLGSDVTCYYGIKVDISERDLFLSEINAYNPYNTRCAAMAGRLPVGPICSPGSQSIIATINPTPSNYYYFVNDINGKVYYSRTMSEHDSTIARLKSQGLWFVHE